MGDRLTLETADEAEIYRAIFIAEATGPIERRPAAIDNAEDAVRAYRERLPASDAAHALAQLCGQVNDLRETVRKMASACFDSGQGIITGGETFPDGDPLLIAEETRDSVIALYDAVVGIYGDDAESMGGAYGDAFDVIGAALGQLSVVHKALRADSHEDGIEGALSDLMSRRGPTEGASDAAFNAAAEAIHVAVSWLLDLGADSTKANAACIELLAAHTVAEYAIEHGGSIGTYTARERPPTGGDPRELPDTLYTQGGHAVDGPFDTLPMGLLNAKWEDTEPPSLRLANGRLMVHATDGDGPTGGAIPEPRDTFACDGLHCPDCGGLTVFGYILRNDAGKHMHTRYVCSRWRSDGDGGRCGWSGWTVPEPSVPRRLVVQAREDLKSSGLHEAAAACDGVLLAADQLEAKRAAAEDTEAKLTALIGSVEHQVANLTTIASRRDAVGRCAAEFAATLRAALDTAKGSERPGVDEGMRSMDDWRSDTAKGGDEPQDV